MQGATHVQEPVLGSWVVSPDRQHFGVQAKLRDLLSIRPREEEKLRKGLAHSTAAPRDLPGGPPASPPPGVPPRHPAGPSPGAGSGLPGLPLAEFLEVQVQRQHRRGLGPSGSSLPGARCPPPGPPGGGRGTRRTATAAAAAEGLQGTRPRSLWAAAGERTAGASLRRDRALTLGAQGARLRW